jgi:hypothetical protein
MPRDRQFEMQCGVHSKNSATTLCVVTIHGVFFFDRLPIVATPYRYSGSVCEKTPR